MSFCGNKVVGVPFIGMLRLRFCFAGFEISRPTSIEYLNILKTKAGELSTAASMAR